MSRLLVLIALTASAVRLPAQAPVSPGAFFLPAVDVERLLPQSSVMDMLQDARGFLWFGTREGVARWDGYAMRVWRHDPLDAASLPGNVIRGMAEDRFGSIWVLAHNYLDQPAGIARIVGPGLDVTERIALPALHVAIDQDGNALAITGDRVYRFDAARGRFADPVARAPRRPPRSLTARALMASAVTPDGRLWLSDFLSGGVEVCDLAAGRCDPVTTQASGVSPDSGLAEGDLFVDGRGQLWIALDDGIGLVRRGASTMERPGLANRPPAEQLPQLPRGTVATAFARDVAGTLWILSGSGVFEIREGAAPVRHRLATLANEANPAPVSMLADRGGTIWVGTVWGLYRHNPRRSAFAHLEHDPQNPNTLSAGLVVSLAEDARGAIWIGTIGGGLNRWDRTTGRIQRYRHHPARRDALSHDIVWALGVDPAGRVWAGTSWGLNRYEPATDGFTRFLRDPAIAPAGLRPSDNVVTDLATDPDGSIWITCAPCARSVHHFDPSTGQFTDVGVAEPAGYLELDGANLWIGALGGVRHLDTRTRTLSPALGSGGGLDGILAFHRSADGSLWVGANSGLFRFERSGSLRRRYTANEGLPGNAVLGILEDARGRLWLSTNRGIVSFDPDAADNAIHLYDHTTGIGNVEFNRNAFLRTRDGTMFFGGDRGVTWFHPDAVLPNTYRPPVVFTALSRSTQRGTRVSHHLGDGPVRVAPEEYTFTFEFAALNYVNPHRNRYAVQLVGFDEDWKPQGTDRRATYTNVPPGRYTFRVRAANDDGLWNDEPASVDVIVEPFIWQTWWFRAGLVLAAAAAVVTATWYVSRNRYRLELQRTAAAHALEAERSRISRDMHDEVGASLTEIAILSEVALRANGTGPDGHHLARIGEKSRATLDAIGEIIWAIDPRNDDGDRFLAHLREYAAGYLESAELRASIAFPAVDPRLRVTADFRRSVFLVLKEALANAVRHGQPAHVRVTLALADGRLDLEVRDDGRGFDPAAVPDESGHDGLRNMRQRAAAIGGSVTIRSAPGGGTTVRLDAPAPPAGVAS